MCNRELYFYSLLLFPVGPVYIYSKNNDNIYYLKAGARSGCMVSTNRKDDAFSSRMKIQSILKNSSSAIFWIGIFILICDGTFMLLIVRPSLIVVQSGIKVCFLLKSSIRDNHQHPVSLSAWISGKEACYIRCARRWGKAYIAVTPPSPFCSIKTKPNGNVFRIIQSEWQDITQTPSQTQTPIDQTSM